jgi:type I restriction enzyme S subunit
MKNLVPLAEIATSLPCHYGDECPSGTTGTPVAKVSNINSAGKFHRDFEHRRFSDRQLRDLLVQEGDLLVVKSSGSKANILSGKTAYCDERVAGTLVASNFLMRLRADPAKAHARYLWHVLNGDFSKAFVRRVAGTTTYPNLKWTTYSAHPIPLPPLEEQQRIAAILDRVQDLEKLAEGQIQKTETLAVSFFNQTIADSRKESTLKEGHLEK